MKHEHMDVFPDSLICKRWTKSAKDDHISSMPSEECDAERLSMFRRGAMSAAFNSLCNLCCKHSGDYKEAMEGIYKLCEKIKRRQDGDGNGTIKDKTNPSIGDPIMVKTKGAPRKKKSVWKKRRCSHCKRTTHTKRKCPVLAGRDGLDEVEDEVSSGQSNDDSRNFNVSLSNDLNDNISSVKVSNGRNEGADNNCADKRKRKGVSVTLSTQDSINKKTSKQVENEQCGGTNANKPDTNKHDSMVSRAFVTPNHTTNIENNVMRHSFGFGNPTVKIERQNATWNYGLGYGANYFTTCNVVPNQSIPMFPQFPPVGIYPSHSNTLLYPGRNSVPHYTPFMGVLDEMERSAKMARNGGGNDDSKFNP